MNVHLYKIECLTNLHVGSGDINYNVVDNEVEKDINGYPMIHSSGLKGALREQAEQVAMKVYEVKKKEIEDKEKKAAEEKAEEVPKEETEEEKAKREEEELKAKKEKDKKLLEECMKPVINIFGQESGSKEIKKGTYKFLDANIICRPLRVYGSPSMASIPVFSMDSINSFLKKINAFGITTLEMKVDGKEEKVDISAYSNGLDKSLFDFEKTVVCDDGSTKVETYEFITTESNIFIEGEKTAVFSTPAKEALGKLKAVLGDKYAIVKNFDNYPLPVLARNYLEDGKSKNLWYEEVVPHGSVFYTIIITPDETNALDMEEIKQIGGHASIGCGFTKFTKLN